MGQKYIAPFDGTTFSSECPWPQQLGFGATGSVWQQLFITGFGWQQDFGSGAGSLVFIRKWQPRGIAVTPLRLRNTRETKKDYASTRLSFVRILGRFGLTESNRGSMG